MDPCGQLYLELSPWGKAWPAVSEAGCLETILKSKEKAKMAGSERTGDAAKRVWLRKVRVL